jgi:hypothetical protein
VGCLEKYRVAESVEETIGQLNFCQVERNSGGSNTNK